MALDSAAKSKSEHTSTQRPCVPPLGHLSAYHKLSVNTMLTELLSTAWKVAGARFESSSLSSFEVQPERWDNVYRDKVYCTFQPNLCESTKAALCLVGTFLPITYVKD